MICYEVVRIVKSGYMVLVILFLLSWRSLSCMVGKYLVYKLREAFSFPFDAFSYKFE